VALACVVTVSVLLASRSPLASGALRVVGVAAGHGALLATALAWAGCGPGSGVIAIVLLAAAAAAATAGPAGALAYLSVPLWIAWLARGRRLAALGLAGPVSRRALLAAVALGAVLGGHLLVSASLTLGVRVRPERVAGILAGLAYDVERTCSLRNASSAARCSTARSAAGPSWPGWSSQRPPTWRATSSIRSGRRASSGSSARHST